MPFELLLIVPLLPSLACRDFDLLVHLRLGESEVAKSFEK